MVSITNYQTKKSLDLFYFSPIIYGKFLFNTLRKYFIMLPILKWSQGKPKGINPPYLSTVNQSSYTQQNYKQSCSGHHFMF